jgi:hypothetical protein
MDQIWQQHFNAYVDGLSYKTRHWHSFITKKEDIHFMSKHDEYQRIEQIIKENL